MAILTSMPLLLLGISQDVTMPTLLLNFLMMWSILGYVLLFILILLGLIKNNSILVGGSSGWGAEMAWTICNRMAQLEHNCIPM